MLERLDLVLAAMLAVGGILVSVIEPATPFRVAIAVPLLLLVPGYLLVLTLLPRESSLSSLERLGLSLASSAALVGLVALVTSLSPIRLSAVTLAGGLALLIAILIASADHQRRAVGQNDAFSPFVMVERGRERRTPLRWSPSLVFLVAALLLSLGAMGLLAAVPPPQERFTELFALDATGAVPGAFQNLTIEVRNHEGDAVTYTLESYLMNQTFDPVSNRTVTRGMELLDSRRVMVGDGQSANVSLSIPPNGTTGANSLGVLLFRGVAPATGGTDEGRLRESYRNLSIRLPATL